MEKMPNGQINFNSLSTIKYMYIDTNLTIILCLQVMLEWECCLCEADTLAAILDSEVTIQEKLSN